MTGGHRFASAHYMYSNSDKERFDPSFITYIYYNPLGSPFTPRHIHLITQSIVFRIDVLDVRVLEYLPESDQLQGPSDFDETTRPVKTYAHDHKSLVFRDPTKDRRSRLFV